MVAKTNKLVILQMGNDINIPSNGMITVMKMICNSSYLKDFFDIRSVFFSFPSLKKSKKLVGTIKALARFFRLISDVDVVHIHHSTGFNFFLTMFFALSSTLYNKKLILHNHGADFREFYQGNSRIVRGLINNTFQRADAVITLSESWKEWHYENIGPGPTWVVMMNPTPLKQPEQPNKVSLHNLSILYMSRLERRKGLYDLLDIIPQITNRLKNITFLLAGDGDIAKVSTILRNKGLSHHVKLLGWVADEEKIDLLKHVDIFVLPSYNEGLPMALLETMSFGIVPIATNVGGIPELISNGKNGILINPRDKAALSRAIFSLANDLELRNDMGRSAYKTIKDYYSIDNYVSKLRQLYLPSRSSQKCAALSQNQ